MVADWHMGHSWGSVREIEMLDGEVRLKPKDEAPPAPDALAPTKVIVVLRDDPPHDSVVQLAALLKSLPGGNAVELQMPAGPVPVGFPCGLTPEHEKAVAALFPGGAVVHYDVDQVPAELAADEDAEA